MRKSLVIVKLSSSESYPSSRMTMDELKEFSNIDISWTADAKYAFGFQRILGRALGVWPLDQQNSYSFIKVAFVIITQLSMSLSLITLLLSKGNCGAITDVADVLSLITSGFLSSLKVLILTIYYYKMRVIVSNSINDWKRVRDKKSRRIMMKYAYMGRIMFIIMMTGAYTVGAPLIIFRIPFIENLWVSDKDFNRTYSTPIGPSCWISSEISVINYSAYYIIQSIQLFITCTAYIGGDTYFFTLAMHVCGQFELLCADFERLNRTSNDRQQKLLLLKLIKRHQHLLIFINHFENVYNLIILGQVMGDTILLCITSIGLLMSLRLNDTIILLQLIIRICLAYTQLFIYCYVGEQLSMKVKKLQVAVYNCNWYEMPYRRVKIIKFIIMRTNYPFCLTAGKIYKMNHENFKNLIKAMGSYFSILRLMLIE